MVCINCSTPICYGNQATSFSEKLLEITDSYLSRSREKAYVIPAPLINGKKALFCVQSSHKKKRF